MDFTKMLNQLTKSDVAIAGGKGAALGELIRAGFDVPRGFVITSAAFEQLLKESDIGVEIDAALEISNKDNIETVEEASEKIQSLILSSEIPSAISETILDSFKMLGARFVAVRSSATVEDGKTSAWAGQLESYLNTDSESLLINVKKCWASLFSPRAIFYRLEKTKKNKSVSIAVVVQEMIESEVAGVAFSVHPVTEDPKQLLIEGAIGLGEAVVSGSITPDSYVVHRDTLEILDKNISVQEKGLFRGAKGDTNWKKLEKKLGESQKLTDKEVSSLSRIVVSIEKHFGFEVDVEWAKQGERFCILQSRPITTLHHKNDIHLRQLEKFLTRDAPLIAIEHWWHKGCTEAFPAFFGFSFPTMIILKTNGAFTAYWDKESLLTNYLPGFRDWLKNNPERINLIHTRLSEGLKAFRDIMRFDTASSSISELLEAIMMAARHFREGLPAVDAVHVLPSLHEQLKNEGHSPFDEAQIRKLISWREEEGNFFFNEGINAFYFLLEKIGKKNGYPQDFLKYITLKELADLSSNNAVFPLNELQKRRDISFALIEGKVVFETEIEDTLFKLGYALKQETVSGIREIKGTSAMPGKAQGTAKVIFERSQLSRVADGDILVAPMTSPWYIPAIRRAAAIVTDEGGITSHAAIISREMNKPCVIGTKYATTLIQDGNDIAVDATEGTVKILTQWTHHLTRPFSLLGATLWHAWYDSDVLTHLIGTRITDALFLEEHPNVVKYYMQKSQRDILIEELIKLVTKEHDRLADIFREGFELNDQAKQALEKGAKAFNSLEDGIAFMVKLALHATVIPNMGLRYLVDLNISNQELVHDAESLRGISLYPKLITECLLPHAVQYLKTFGVQNSEEAAELITLKELQSGDISMLSSRLEARQSKKRFVYRLLNGKESVEWVDDAKPMILQLEGIAYSKDNSHLHGQVAYRGKVKGTARLVLSDDGRGVSFNEGDILVSINSNPTMMPLILKCSAIVTDEGGAGCHAAIISRELKKPCVIGTKHATALIKDGDTLEVDAEKGVVNII